MILWLIFSLFLLAVATLLLWPLLSRPDQQTAAAGRALTGYDAEVYKDQLGEIDQDIERGLLSEAEGAAAKVEIARRLLKASSTTQPSETALPYDGGMDRRIARWRAHSSESSGTMSGARSGIFSGILSGKRLVVSALTLLFVTGVPLALYISHGHPGLSDLPHAARINKAIPDKRIASLVRRVEDQLRKHPDDARGWAVIAPVYLRLEFYEKAARAYRRAIELKGPTPQLLVGFAESVRLANKGVITPLARKAYAAALKMDKELIIPNIALALAKAQDGQFGAAAHDLQLILKRGDDKAPWRALVQQQLAAITALANKAGQKIAAVPDASVASKAPPANQTQLAQSNKPGDQASEPGPSAEDVRAARQMSATDRAAMIEQMVARLAERLNEKGGSPGEWIRLMRAYSVLGKKARAQATLEKAGTALKNDAQAVSLLRKTGKALGLDVSKLAS